MTARRFALSAALLAAAALPARAQDPPPDPAAQARPAVERARVKAGNDAPPARQAVPRAVPVAARADRSPAPAVAEDQGGRRRPGGGSSGAGGQRPGGDPNRGAVPRQGGVRSPDAGRGGGQVAQAVPRGRAGRPGPIVVPNYGRRYATGPYGLGYYFYDPWSWYGYGWPAYGAYGYGGWPGGWGGGGGYYGAGGYGSPYGWGLGGVRLKVTPRDAEVYVDGYYAGVVDDFDGLWQQLRLDDGGYHIEIRKPGFQTLAFDLRVLPGRTITYRGQLEPAP